MVVVIAFTDKRFHFCRSGRVVEASRSRTLVVYDVFLSHRGPEVKKSFCAFLYEALERAGVRVFLDKIDLEIGDRVWLTMKDALQNAHIKIPVRSKGYTESQWCLDELVIMMSEPEEVRQKSVMPVFYGWGADLQGVEDIRYVSWYKALVQCRDPLVLCGSDHSQRCRPSGSRKH
jgi:hypothetical protein